MENTLEGMGDTNSNIKYILSTMGIEGLVPSQTAIDYAVKVEQGKMSLEQAIEAIKKTYEVSKTK